MEPHVEGLELLPPVYCTAPMDTCADFVATASGRWSDPNIWSGAVPSRAAAGPTLHVAILPNVTVTFDAAMSDGDYIDTLRLQGTLTFDPSKSTRLVVHTLVSETAGVLQVGTAAAPIASGNKAEIVIANAPFADNDPKQLDVLG